MAKILSPCRLQARVSDSKGKEKRHPEWDTEKPRLRAEAFAPLRARRIVVCGRLRKSSARQTPCLSKSEFSLFWGVNLAKKQHLVVFSWLQIRTFSASRGAEFKSKGERLQRKRKTTSRLGCRKATASCRGFCATPHPSHSRLRSPTQVFGSADSLLVEERIFALLGCQPCEKTTFSCFFLVADSNLLR